MEKLVIEIDIDGFEGERLEGIKTAVREDSSKEDGVISSAIRHVVAEELEIQRKWEEEAREHETLEDFRCCI